MVSQLVIGIAGELSARKGERFDSYAEAIRNLHRDERFDSDVIHALERLPGFRNVVVHEYVGLDLNRVVEALNELSPIEQFLRSVAELEKD